MLSLENRVEFYRVGVGIVRRDPTDPPLEPPPPTGPDDGLGDPPVPVYRRPR